MIDSRNLLEDDDRSLLDRIEVYIRGAVRQVQGRSPGLEPLIGMALCALLGEIIAQGVREMPTLDREKLFKDADEMIRSSCAKASAGAGGVRESGR